MYNTDDWISGNASWEDGLRASLRIMWKQPAVLAGEIYSWASTAEILGTVYTVYELHSGEENVDSGRCISRESS